MVPASQQNDLWGAVQRKPICSGASNEPDQNKIASWFYVRITDFAAESTRLQNSLSKKVSICLSGHLLQMCCSSFILIGLRSSLKNILDAIGMIQGFCFRAPLLQAFIDNYRADFVAR
jgi:hypothetical protein